MKIQLLVSLLASMLVAGTATRAQRAVAIFKPTYPGDERYGLSEVQVIY